MRTKKQANSVRIIAGQWRGRKLPVRNAEGLRPTTDRVRETLFNWLMPYLSGSHCLDLFAGTGILGLEAVSRGAVQSLLIEKNKQAAASIQHVVAEFNASDQVSVNNTDALLLTKKTAKKNYDIVFVDPPYQLNCQSALCQALEDNNWLSNEAFIAVEAAKGATLSLPDNWQIHRQLHAGNSTLVLCRRNALK